MLLKPVPSFKGKTITKTIEKNSEFSYQLGREIVMDFYKLRKKDVLELKKSTEKGLTSKQAKQRLKQFGKNEIVSGKKVNPLKLFVDQFNNTLVLILIAAAIVSWWVGEWHDTVLILAIVVLNALFSFWQDYSAEKSIQALQKMASKIKAKVLRDGKEVEIPSTDLVPGDIVLLSEGDKVPADLRILESANLKVDESILTGESTGVTKHSNPIKEDCVVADQKNMLFMNTAVNRGTCKAVVVGTGMQSEFGKIAESMRGIEAEQTPLQVSLDKLGKKLGYGTLVLSALVILISVFVKGTTSPEGLVEVFLLAVALAVAAIPEGLPAIVTLSLALGVSRMVKKRALVRSLPSVETLGTTTVICTDKTGTLTVGDMTVREVYAGKRVKVTGEGYKLEGDFLAGGKKLNPSEDLHLMELLKNGAYCNNATLTEDGVIGDPTEGALLVAAKKAGIERVGKRVSEIPFESERMRMSVVYDEDKERVAYTKGAPDAILDLCSKQFKNGKIVKLSEKDKEEILKVNEEMAGNALRVLAAAYKPIPKNTTSLSEKTVETDLIFLGLWGMIDPPRPEVKPAIEKCKDANIRVVMITGDHKNTAIAIAKEIGMVDGEDCDVLTGSELDDLSEAEFTKKARTTCVYARVSPQHKLRIINALREDEQVVAMTGDGVNDSPALKKSDIGIAMGIRGTDVAKEASDVILLDDNFATIVTAIEEGRGIFDNIRKFVSFLLSANIAEVLVVFTAALVFTAAPLSAAQLLWINLLTDGIPALALGVDPSEPGIMKRKPRGKDERVLTPHLIQTLVFIGVLLASVLLAIYWFEEATQGHAKAQSIVFTAFVFYELIMIQLIRNQYKLSLTSNKWLLLAIGLALVLQLTVVYYEPLGAWFDVVPLSLEDWITIGAGFVAFAVLGFGLQKVLFKNAIVTGN